MSAPVDLAIGVLVALGATGWYYERRRQKKILEYDNELDIDYDEYEEDEPWPAPEIEVQVPYVVPRGVYSEEPAYPAPITAEAPLSTWRRTRMSQVTNIPATLLHNGAPVTDGQLLPIGGPNSGRQVKVLDAKPDANGAVRVQENFMADAAEISCTVVQEKVVMELTPDEARDFMKFYEQLQSAKQQSSATDTIQRAAPLFQDLEQGVSKRQ